MKLEIARGVWGGGFRFVVLVLVLVLDCKKMNSKEATRTNERAK
jgi:hypothetical protein